MTNHEIKQEIKSKISHRTPNVLLSLYWCIIDPFCGAGGSKNKILESYHEVVATLKKIEIKDDCLKLLFTMDREIEVPKSAFSHDELLKFIDEKIGIIRIGDTYRLRRI